MPDKYERALPDAERGPALGPFTAHLGFRLIQADEEGSVLEADPGPEHLNGGGIVHGGYLGALLDSTTGWAVHSRLPAGVGAPHIQIGVQFIRAALPGTTLVCRGRCISAGRRIASAEAEITQAGKLIAKATTNHIVLSRD